MNIMKHRQTKRLAVALFILAQLTGASNATPISFTLDSSTSALGFPNSVPLTGSVLGNFDATMQTLSFAGGSSFFSGTPLLNSGNIAAQTYNLSGLGSVSVSGTYQTTISSTSFDITSGSIINGGGSSGLQLSSASAGGFNGTLNADYSILGIPLSQQISFMGNLATPSAFSSTGSASLTGTSSGTNLALNFNAPLSVNNLQFSSTGELSALLGAFTSLIQNAVTSNPVSQLPGSIFASSTTVLPPPPPQPVPVTYTIDATRSALSIASNNSPLTGSIAANLLNGELSFAGGSQINASHQFGATSIQGTASGVTFDVMINSILLDQAFDITSGLASQGSAPSALGWTQSAGLLTIMGNANLEFLLGGLVTSTSTPFTLTASLDLFMQLIDNGNFVQLLQAGDMETIEMPLAFDNINADLNPIQLEAGNFGNFANLFIDFLIPNLQQYVLGELRSAPISGTIVATRGITAAVPEPGSIALLLAGLASLLLIREFRKTTRKQAST